MSIKEEVILKEELDYDDVEVISGEYEHFQVTCQEALTTYPVSSGSTVTFQIVGSNVVNLSKSYLEFTVSVPIQAAATNSIWLMGGSIPMFRTVAFQPSSGKQLFMDFYHHYSKMSLPYLMSATQTEGMDISNLYCASRVSKDLNKTAASGFNSAVANNEHIYAHNIGVGAVINNFLVRIPFKLFAGTILSENRDFAFGQAVNIQFTMEAIDKWLWSSASATNPAQTPIPLNIQTVTLNNIFLQLAVEKNPMAVKRVKELALKGYSCYVPDVKILFRQLIPIGASQNIVAPTINKGYGEKLMRIFVSPFNATENINTSLDNANQTASPCVDASTNRVTSFQTLLNSDPRQQRFITASPAAQFTTGGFQQATVGGTGDWERYNKYLEGSSIFSSGTLGLNWTYVDDFTAPESRMEKYIKGGHELDGFDLTIGDATWQFNSNTASTAFNWYVFIQSARLLRIGPGYLSID